MRAASLKNGTVAVRDVATPEPGPGQLLVRTLACAICASDHHYMDHPEVSRADKSGMRVHAPECDVVMGHEYCAEVVEYGPGCEEKWEIGAHVTGPPALITGDGMRIIGMAPDAPGGFGEYFLLQEFLVKEVPARIEPERIALCDPLAVGWGYSRMGLEGTPPEGSVPLVIGLGAIGLGVVLCLKHRGASPIIAADFSRERRALATQLGADVVVDPTERSVWEAWREVAWGSPEEVHDRLALFGRPTQVVYEMVGRDGMLGDIVDHCQIGTRIISCGGAAEDTIPTTTAHMKALNLQIGGAPSTAHDDWFACLEAIVNGEIDPMPLMGETVSLDELPDAIERARRPSAPVRILYTTT